MECPFKVGDYVMIIKSSKEMDEANRNSRLYLGKIGCVERIHENRYNGHPRWSVQCTWEGHGGWTWWVYDDEIAPAYISDIDYALLL